MHFTNILFVIDTNYLLTEVNYRTEIARFKENDQNLNLSSVVIFITMN